ncbi:MAG: hypothetical protein M3345_08490 [Actinomycetota bacterium]|nr:hypothetical protein [Actinomycetota bacterium]
MGVHRQVRIHHGTFEADVDEGIADLILEMWRAGIETVSSCQEPVAGFVQVWLTADSAKRFAQVVLPFEDPDDSMYARALKRTEDEDQDWMWSANIDDAGLMCDIDDDEIIWSHTGVGEWEILLAVYFPHSDQDEILDRLRRSNARNPDGG